MSRVIALVIALSLLLVAPAHAQTPQVPAPKAWLLVDADTGAVIDAGHAREPMLVASVFKILTAVVVRENLAPGAEVPVSARAEAMPARKMNIKAGQVWRSDDLMHALLLVSANDAAVALAERTAGSLEAFGGMLDTTAARLGMADRPVLRDPAGLDDEFSVDGGNLISPRDLAIATRAFLSYPELASIVVKPEYRFDGGDGHPHRLLNHNRIVKTYPGSLGIKTGYTKRAGHSLIAAAQRDGRTMIAVVIGAGFPYDSAAQLMDRGFATPVSAQAGLETLPPVRLGTATDPSTNAAPAARPVSTPTASEAKSNAGAGASLMPLWLLAVGGLPAAAILIQRRRVRIRAIRRARAAARRGSANPSWHI